MSVIFKKEQTIALLKRLVETPSPSGYTTNVMALIAKEFDEIGVSYKKTNKGAVIATIEGTDTSRHRLLTAHTDTLGAMVKEVKSNGRLKLTTIGGFNWNAVEGEYCVIHTAGGKEVRGTEHHLVELTRINSPTYEYTWLFIGIPHLFPVP